MSRSRLRAGLAMGAVAALAVAGAAAAAPRASTHRTIGVISGAHAGLNTSQSNNWSGYNQGVLDQGGTGFHSISGEWVVPTAKPAKSGEDEYSSSWLGIGGGCLDTSCTLTDSTLIQAGTEQDVAANGTASYSTWYELIPAPSIATPLAVKPGDTMKVSIAETVPEVWTITMTNVTTGQSWNTTVPYTSTYGTAEWIEETPVVLGGSGGAQVGPLPNLGTVHFDQATANGANAALTPAQAIQLVDFNNKVLATPSNPDSTADGFNDCAYTTSCPVPTSELSATTATSGTGHRKTHAKGRTRR